MRSIQHVEVLSLTQLLTLGVMNTLLALWVGHSKHQVCEPSSTVDVYECLAPFSLSPLLQPSSCILGPWLVPVLPTPPTVGITTAQPLLVGPP